MDAETRNKIEAIAKSHPGGISNAVFAGAEAMEEIMREREAKLVKAARQVEEWFDISNPERVGFKRGPGDLIPNDSMAAGAVISVIEALRKFERGGT